MWWRWQKIRRASITPELREHFELYGETLMALAVESGDANRIGEDLVKLGQQKRPEIVQWLRERRDIAARREDSCRNGGVGNFIIRHTWRYR